MDLLSGKSVFLTGASRGVGRAIAERLSHHKVKLGLLGRSKEDLREVAQGVQKNGSEVLILCGDLREQKQVKATADQFQEKFGVPYLLINNAGIGDRGYWENLSLDLELDMMAVNYLAPVTLTRLFLPKMLRSDGGGHIININSIAGLYTSPFTGAYCASKSALLAYFTSLAHELEKTNIKISSIFTGSVDTDFMHQSGFVRFKDRSGILKPDDVAQKVLQAVEEPRERIFVGSWINFMLIKLVNWQPLLFRRLIESRNPPPLPTERQSVMAGE